MAKPRRKHPQKLARVRGEFIEHVDRFALLRLYDGRCGICGHKVAADKFTVDHIIPASKGGIHAYVNTRPSHAFCNAYKGDKMPWEVSPEEVIAASRRSKRRKRYKKRKHNGITVDASLKTKRRRKRANRSVLSRT